MAMEPQQASAMSKMDGTRLLNTPWPFWTCISTPGISKNDDEEDLQKARSSTNFII